MLSIPGCSLLVSLGSDRSVPGPVVSSILCLKIPLAPIAIVHMCHLLTFLFVYHISWCFLFSNRWFPDPLNNFPSQTITFSCFFFPIQPDFLQFSPADFLRSFRLAFTYMRTMVLEYESQHLPEITHPVMSINIPVPWLAYGISINI